MYTEPQIKNDESTRCQVTPGPDNEDEPIKKYPHLVEKKLLYIIAGPLSDGPSFIGPAVNPGLNTARIGLWDRDN